MDKISTLHFEFTNGNMFCVGSERAIADIHNNFIIQKESNDSIDLKAWCNRIINNRLYCRFEPKGLHGLYILFQFYFLIKKHNLWITENDYDEALYLSH